MTVTDQIKILDRKIKQNEAQYDLDRKVAKISALSSNNLDKYEYLTSEYMGLKPSTVEQVKSEYSPLGKFFNKGLKEEEKKEGLLKRLKNIEDKNDEQLKAIEDQKEIQTKIISKNKIKPHLLKSIYNQGVKDGRINKDAVKKIFKTLEDTERSEINYSKLVYKSGGNKYFDFNRFGPLSSCYLKLMNGNIGIDVVKLNMEEFKKEIDTLEKKTTKKEPYKKNKEGVLKNTNVLYNGLNIIVDVFEKRIFEYEVRPKIDVDYDLDTYDSNTYNLTDKELRMFKKRF